MNTPCLGLSLFGSSREFRLCPTLAVFAPWGSMGRSPPPVPLADEGDNATWTGDGDSDDDGADLTDGQHDQKSFYYLKFSHSSEHPLPFVERSLPFFRQPPAFADADAVADADAAGDGGAGGFDAGGVYWAKSDKPPGDEMGSVVESEGPPSRYSERKPNGQEAWGSEKAAFPRPRRRGSQYWRGVSERRRGSFVSDVEGPEGEETGGGSEGGSGEESGDAGMDIFLREARLSKGIHCRVGMDGVSRAGRSESKSQGLTRSVGRSVDR